MNKSDLLSMLVNFASIVDPLINLTVIVSAIIGVLMVGDALMKAYWITKGSGWQGKGTLTYGGIVWSLVIGGVLLTPVVTVQIFGNTLLDVSVNGAAFSYQGAGLTATQQAALKAIYGLFSFVGFVAFIRGWIILNKHFNGVIPEGVGAGLTHIIFGVILIYLDVFLGLLQSQTGWDFSQTLLF